MNAADHLKILRKRRSQTYAPQERIVLDALIYLLESTNAQEQDVADQISRANVPDELEMEDAFTQFWHELTMRGDPGQIPNKIRTGFYAGWKARSGER